MSRMSSRPAASGSGWRLLAVAALLAAGVWLLTLLGIDIRHLSAEQVRVAVLAHGAWAPLVYLAVFGQPVIPLPGSAMLALAGVVFGKAWGPVAGLVGITLRGVAAFAVARLLGRGMVERLLHGHVARLNAKLGKRAFSTVFFIRLIPNVPLDMQNYALSFSRVRFGPYVLGTMLGFIPASIAYAYLGDSLTDTGQVWKFIVAVLLVAAVAWLPRMWRPAKRGPTIQVTRGS
jgi:uncharacterized membrane protein YdjX (TVP38/TMEM64 family)